MKTQEQIDKDVLIKERREAFFEAMENLTEVAPTKTLFGVIAQAEKEVKRHAYANSDRYKISTSRGKSAYGYQIDKACPPVASIRLAATEHEEDIDEVMSVRHDKWNHNRSMIGVYEDFFNGVGLATGTKELRVAVRSATTLNGGLTRVYNFQKHEAEIRELRERLDKLENQQINTTVDLEFIKDISGWKIKPKEKAVKLRNTGMTYLAIADILDVSERTVRRWVNNTK